MFDRSFFFLRHGQTDWNIQGRLQGFMDIPLNAAGVQQAKEVAAHMAALPIETCITSDLSRAVTTAKYALKYCDVPLYIHADLKERSFGTWEGQLSREQKQRAGLNPEMRLTDYTPEGGETWAEFTQRVVRAIQNAQRTYSGELLFVAHGYVFVALSQLLTGSDIMSANCVPYRFEKKGAAWDIIPL